MNEQQRHDLFSELTARYQSELYAYLFAIVRNWEDAADLYQSVCLILWRKFDQFEPGTNFFAWARQAAKMEARNFLRRKRSPSHISEELLDAFAETVTDDGGEPNDESEFYLTVLQRCKSKLDDFDRQLLDLRYAKNLGSREIADAVGRSQQSVCHSLKRIRETLLQCIQVELAQQRHSEESF